MTTVASDTPAERVARLHRAGASLRIDTPDLCFLAALDAVAKMRQLASLDDDVLREVYVVVAEVAEPGAPHVQTRATNAIDRLARQRLLQRVNAGGLARAGQYSLSSLATGIVAYFAEDEKLTRQSLLVLTTTLRATLLQVLGAARPDRDAESWAAHVFEPLRVAVTDLVRAIDTRKRGLDADQADIRARIQTRLTEDWFASIEECETLLQDTAATLGELHEVLMVEVEALSGTLSEIAEVALATKHFEVERVAIDLTDQLEGIAAWGRDRMDAWAGYFEHVQRFLRGVVRLDPDRAVSERLRDAVGRWPDHPWSLRLAGAEPYAVLREPEPAKARTRVARAAEERDRALVDVEPPRPPLDIAAVVAAELATVGSVDLPLLLEKILPAWPGADWPRVAGQVFGELASRGHVVETTPGAWVPVLERLEIQQLHARSRS
jgi:chromosome partition protein MukF